MRAQYALPNHLTASDDHHRDGLLDGDDHSRWASGAWPKTRRPNSNAKIRHISYGHNCKYGSQCSTTRDVDKYLRSGEGKTLEDGGVAFTSDAQDAVATKSTQL